jgi:DNA-binding transcriptional LysR family regulator
MVPTEFGARLIDPLRNALRVIDFIRSQQPRFAARTSVRTYRIGCPDYLNVLFVPKLVALFRERAPDAQLVFHPLGDGFDAQRALADGALDVVIDNRPAHPARFRHDALFDDRIVCVMRATHPLARRGAMTAEEFAQAPQLCRRRRGWRRPARSIVSCNASGCDGGSSSRSRISNSPPMRWCAPIWS